jgi:uncharacterized damage-inducible protein DinB
MSELTDLRSFVDAQRATLLRQVAGLDAAQLAQPLPPSTMTLGGMLKHLAYVEDFWLGVVLLDQPPTPPFEAVDWRTDRDWDWRTAADDSPEELLRMHADAVGRSDAVLAAVTDPEARAARGHRRTGEAPTVRWILLHLVEEYARHLGHADLIRESIDGATGL